MKTITAIEEADVEERDAVGMNVARDQFLQTQWVLSDDLALEARDATHVTLFHKTTAARLKVSDGIHRLLLNFAQPKTLAEAAPGELSERLLPQLQTLVGKGILVDADAPPLIASPRLLSAVAYRFCNAPAFDGAASAGFTVLGVPYDLASTRDCRGSPSAIRQKSVDYSYEILFATGRPQGWFDANRGSRILAGATLADAGDVHVEYGEHQRDLFARVGNALDATISMGSVPVVLGGDRSVTFAVVDYLRRREPLTVVQFAPKPALAAITRDGFVNDDAVGSALLALEGVQTFVGLGGADAQSDGTIPPRAVLASASTLRRTGSTAMARQIGEGRALHVSIDLGIASPALMTPDDSGMAAGLMLHELKSQLLALGAAHRIVGIDLVGLDQQSEAASLRAISACHLALTAMSAAHDRQEPCA